MLFHVLKFDSKIFLVEFLPNDSKWFSLHAVVYECKLKHLYDALSTPFTVYSQQH